MTTPLSDKVVRYILKAGLLRPHDRVVLAVSGGADSMVMLSLFAGISKELRLSLIAAHVHHGLRAGEADADERCVRLHAQKLGVPFRRTRVDVRQLRRATGCSMEEAARELRYAALERIRKVSRADVIATAHHADDQAETVYLRATRGADVKGLAGILPQLTHPPVIRPLLTTMHQELLGHALSQSIPYREDSSNRDVRIRRNAVRHQELNLVGHILDIRPSVSLPRLAESARRLDSMLESALHGFGDRNVRWKEDKTLMLELDALQKLPAGMRSTLTASFLRKAGVEPTKERVERCMSLAFLQTGKVVYYRGVGVRIYRDRGMLIAHWGSPAGIPTSTIRPGQQVSIGSHKLKAGKPRRVPSRFVGNSSVAWVDAAQLRGPLKVRGWRPGDWFIPLGMRGRKKLSDFLSECKVPTYRKRQIAVVTSGRNIVWVCGLRSDERFKITSSTQEALQFTFS